MIRQGHDGWYRLVTEGGAPVDAGARLKNFRDEPAILWNGEAPHKPAAEGYVSTTLGRHYAGVYNLKWEKTS